MLLGGITYTHNVVQSSLLFSMIFYHSWLCIYRSDLWFFSRVSCRYTQVFWSPLSFPLPCVCFCRISKQERSLVSRFLSCRKKPKPRMWGLFLQRPREMVENQEAAQVRMPFPCWFPHSPTHHQLLGLKYRSKYFPILCYNELLLKIT